MIILVAFIFISILMSSAYFLSLHNVNPEIEEEIEKPKLLIKDLFPETVKTKTFHFYDKVNSVVNLLVVDTKMYYIQSLFKIDNNGLILEKYSYITNVFMYEEITYDLILDLLNSNNKEKIDAAIYSIREIYNLK